MRVGGLRRLALVGMVLVGMMLFVSGCLQRPDEHPTKLTYQLPAKVTLAAGGELPGTGIRYLRMSDKGAYVIIKGQEALKRKGDSLDWSGTPAPGVSLDIRTRIIWYTEKELYLVGTVKAVIEGINPHVATVKSSPLEYSGPVAYGLARGALIPGSTLSFEGQTAEGAKIGGIEGYPYRKVGDSIAWDGLLRDQVYLRLDLRVLQFDEKSMRVGGIATLWIGP
jgi:hypothetical protein